MANRKRNSRDITARQQAQVVVDLFLDVVFSQDGDAGWEGAGLIGKLVEFKGELPRSSGFGGFSKAYEQSKRLQDWSGEHAMACLMMSKLSNRQCEALCVDRAYRGRTKVAVDPFTPEKRVEIHWDDKACAEYVRCSVPAFVQRVFDGYRTLESALQSKMAA